MTDWREAVRMAAEAGDVDARKIVNGWPTEVEWRPGMWARDGERVNDAVMTEAESSAHPWADDERPAVPSEAADEVGAIDDAPTSDRLVPSGVWKCTEHGGSIHGEVRPAFTCGSAGYRESCRWVELLAPKEAT